MGIKTIVGKAGKITLPLEYLKAMGVSTGDKVVLKAQGPGVISLEKA